MDNALERQLSRRGVNRSAKRNRAVPGQFPKRLITAPPLDRPGNALRQQEPPRNDVAIPGIDDHVDLLVEQIAFDDADGGRHNKNAISLSVVRN